MWTFVHNVDNHPQYGQMSMVGQSNKFPLTRCFLPKLSTRFGFVQEESYQSYRLSSTLPERASFPVHYNGSMYWIMMHRPTWQCIGGGGVSAEVPVASPQSRIGLF